MSEEGNMVGTSGAGGVYEPASILWNTIWSTGTHWDHRPVGPTDEEEGGQQDSVRG